MNETEEASRKYEELLAQRDQRIAELEAACYQPIFSSGDLGTPGKLICIRCRLCGSECQNHGEMKHDFECPLFIGEKTV